MIFVIFSLFQQKQINKQQQQKITQEHGRTAYAWPEPTYGRVSYDVFFYVCIQMDEVRMCIDIECSASFAHWKLATR